MSLLPCIKDVCQFHHFGYLMPPRASSDIPRRPRYGFDYRFGTPPGAVSASLSAGPGIPIRRLLLSSSFPSESASRERVSDVAVYSSEKIEHDVCRKLKVKKALQEALWPKVLKQFLPEATVSFERINVEHSLHREEANTPIDNKLIRILFVQSMSSMETVMIHTAQVSALAIPFAS